MDSSIIKISTAVLDEEGKRVEHNHFSLVMLPDPLKRIKYISFIIPL